MKKLKKSNKSALKATGDNCVIVEGDLQKVAALVMASALNGSEAHQKLILDTYGKRKGRPIKIEAGLIKTPHDCAALATAIISLMCEGKITPDETATVLGVLAQKVKLLEIVNFEPRIALIESTMGLNENSYKNIQTEFNVDPLVQEKLIKMRLKAAENKTPDLKEPQGIVIT